MLTSRFCRTGFLLGFPGQPQFPSIFQFLEHKHSLVHGPSSIFKVSSIFKSLSDFNSFAFSTFKGSCWLHQFLPKEPWPIFYLWASWLANTSVQFSRSVVSDSLRPHESQHARHPCPSPIPGVHPSSCASSQWCHPAISSSVILFSSCPQSLAASGSFPISQLFA